MATARNTSRFGLPITVSSGNTVAYGDVDDVDPGDAGDAALIASGSMTIVDPDAAPGTPASHFVDVLARVPYDPARTPFTIDARAADGTRFVGDDGRMRAVEQADVRPRVAAIGASMTAGHGARPGTGLGAQGWVTWAMFLSGGRVKYGQHLGIPGATAQGVRDDALPTILALADRPAYCCVDALTNNTSDTDLAAGKQAVLDICESLREAGIKPILVNAWPGNQASPSTPPTALQRTNAAHLNAWMARLAEETGALFLDVRAALVDPATGGYRDAADTVDGLHLSVAGAKKAGQALADLLAPIALRTPTLRVDNGGTFDILPNGCFLTDMNADGLADGWTSYASAPAAKNLVTGDAAIVGNWQRITNTNPANTVLVAAGVGAIPVTAGHRLSWSGRLKINSLDSGAYVSLFLADQSNGAFGGDGNYIVWNKVAVSGAFELDCTVPEGMTGITLGLQIAGGAADVQIAQQSIRDLTLMGAA